MAKSSNQKRKILNLMRMLERETDENHRLTMGDILSRLGAMGIEAERKSLYSDMEELRLFGMDVIWDRSGYALVSRDFELAELKLLVDSVQASRFITEKKSADLIRKIEKLGSMYEAEALQRQVYLANRSKASNESILRSVDTLHEAVRKGKMIAFRYFEYLPDKSRRYRNGGEDYIVSPYGMTVAEDNYYLIAHSEKRSGLTHYRVDRMTDIKILTETAEDLKAVMGDRFDLGEYYRKNFSMFAGEAEQVKLLCKNKLASAVIDRFGEGVHMRPEGVDRFVATVKVSVSPTFFAWVFTFGDEMKIIEPDTVREEFAQTLATLSRSYGLFGETDGEKNGGKDMPEIT